MALATFSRFSRAVTSRPSSRRMAWALCSAASSSVHFLSDTGAQQGKRKIHSYNTSTFFIWFCAFIKTYRELWIHLQSTSCWEQTRVLQCNCKALKHFLNKFYKNIYLYVCTEIINIHTWQLCSPFVCIRIFKLKIWGLRQPLFTTHESTHQLDRRSLKTIARTFIKPTIQKYISHTVWC